MFKGSILKTRTPIYIVNGSYSVYKGVLVVWDEDYDSRILDFIDELHQYIREKLISVSEHEGSIYFLWAESVPDEFSEGVNVVVRGDHWGVNSDCVKSN